MLCEVKSSGPQEIKVDLEEGTFEGFPAHYGNIDGGSDRLLANSGKHIADANPMVPIYYGHGWIQNERPIGKSLVFEDRPEGLWSKGKVFDTQDGRDILVGMREGLLNSLSIGWTPVDYNVVKEDGKNIREVSKWDISEYSVLPQGFAMNEEALITAVKTGLLARIFDESISDEDPADETKEDDHGDRTDLTDGQIKEHDYGKLREFVQKADPVAMLLDEATYLHELAKDLKAEGREDEVRRALDELGSASLILKGLCAVKHVETEPTGDDLLAVIRKTTANINEARDLLSSKR